MQTIILLVHVLAALGMVGLILMQHGKGADAGAAFGSGASATVFGAQGSGSFVTRLTAALATIFFITTLTLAYLSGHPEEAATSVVDRVALPQQEATPQATEEKLFDGLAPAAGIPAPALEEPVVAPAEKAEEVAIPVPAAPAEEAAK
ncbi:MAG: preprotein translocase subunit SecG [Gammaproteobacteria bacterium]|nr:preprotein translocase subunit SecG [Gammaproteobacteria bacterium]